MDFVNPFRLNLTVTSSHTWAPGLVFSTTQQAATTLARATIQWTPTAAGTVNLTLTAFDGVETTIVPLTLTSSGQCCQGHTVEVWDPSTDALIEPLLSGGLYCLRNYALRAKPCPEPAPMVDMKLWNSATGSTVNRQKEYEAPYFLHGNKDSDVTENPKPLPNGPYIFRFTASGVTTEVPYTQACS